MICDRHVMIDRVAVVVINCMYMCGLLAADVICTCVSNSSACVSLSSVDEMLCKNVCIVDKHLYKGNNLHI